MANGCRTDKRGEHGHRYHPESGWCVNDCGHRDDGRLVIYGTEKRPAQRTQSPADVYTTPAPPRS